jgi:hypothetical protein
MSNIEVAEEDGSIQITTAHLAEVSAAAAGTGGDVSTSVTAILLAQLAKLASLTVSGGDNTALLEELAAIEALLTANTVPVGTASTAITPSSPSSMTRAVLVGTRGNGATYTPVGMLGNSIRAAITSPLSAFGELRTIKPTPRFQADFVYGFRQSDHYAELSDGTVTELDSVATLATGTTDGAFARVMSRRFVRYLAGQGVLIEVTSTFPASPNNSIIGAGAFSATEGLIFCRLNGVFGLTRVINGKQTIVRLTISSRATGAENMTVTLNGAAFVVASGGSLADTLVTAQKIATGTFTGWTATSRGSTVTFLAISAGATGGAFTFASSGAAAGAFATIMVGVANDYATNFVPQANWSEDVMDGSNSSSNPSGMSLLESGVPSATTMILTNILLTQVMFPFLGVGAISFLIVSPEEEPVLVHKIKYPGSARVPTMRNPTLRGGWFLQSLGSTTALSMEGVCTAGYIDGEVHPTRNPAGTPDLAFTATAAETVALAIRVSSTFPIAAAGERANLREVIPLIYKASTGTANRTLSVRAVLNGTPSATMNWTAAGADTCVEYASVAGVTLSGGSTIGAAAGINLTLDMASTETRIQPGDVIYFLLIADSSTAASKQSCIWNDL